MFNFRKDKKLQEHPVQPVAQPPIPPPLIKHSIYNNELEIQENKIIPDNFIIPKHIDTINIPQKYTQPIDILKYNNNILKIQFKNRYVNHIPYIGVFNQPLNNLPINLRELDIMYTNYNHPLHVLPYTLTKLLLSDTFNHNLDLLPESLQILKLGSNYNKKLDDLPSGLKVLDLGNGFMTPDSILPGGIEEIYLFDYQRELFDKRFWSRMKLLNVNRKRNLYCESNYDYDVSNYNS